MSNMPLGRHSIYPLSVAWRTWSTICPPIGDSEERTAQLVVMNVRTHIQLGYMEWCYTCLFRNLCQCPPPENEVMVLQNCLRWYFVTSPRPEPERVQPMKLYVIIFYQQTMRTFIISSTKCRRDGKPFAPPDFHSRA